MGVDAVPSLVLAHGDAVPLEELAGAWEAPPTVLAAAGLALVLFAQAFVRLRRRGRSDLASWGRAALFATAVAVATIALVSPLDAAGEEYLLSAHMLQHVLLADIAPALALLALRGPLLFFLLPAAVLRFLAGLRPLRAVLARAVRPGVALAVWALVFATWHVPAAYEAALANRALHDLQHVTFVVAGALVWNQLLDPAGRGELSPARRLALLAIVFWAGQALSSVLLFSFSPLYGTYAAQDERLLGLEPLLDQKLAGLVMMSEQLVAFGLCAVLLYGLLRRERGARARAAVAGEA